MRAESSAIRRRAGGHRGTQAGPADALNERYRNILDAASVLFAERGYASTSIRDIGERVGLLGGSLYHHIKSKEDLFLKVHDTALRHAADAIQLAVSRVDDPWDRLQVACTTLFEIQVDRNSMTMPLMNDLGAVPEALRIRLIRTRDEFEEIFAGIVEALPMPAGIDRKVYRLLLLTLLNNAGKWYRPGRLSPQEFTHQIMLIFRHRLDSANG